MNDIVERLRLMENERLANGYGPSPWGEGP